MTTWFLSLLFTVGKPRNTAQNSPEAQMFWSLPSDYLTDGNDKSSNSGENEIFKHNKDIKLSLSRYYQKKRKITYKEQKSVADG